ncbi:MAG: GGDEF domain-containing protein, partial [Candidatus Saganbacteria bacterium]|nr:GGDEF domain-containing protein [Candidatus Saganbacteria bacterium]
IPLFVNQADIRACQDLLVEEREAAGVWQLAQTSNPVLEDLLQWLNFDTKTGALTQNAFESKLDEIYATKASYTLASVDINAFGSFNFTFNSDKSVLGKLLGDHAVNVLCQLFDQAFAKAGISATVYRTGGDELQVLSKKTAPILGAALKRTLPAILEAAAQDSDLELKIPENKVDSEMRLKLAAQGIRPKNGIYSINIFSLERISPKYAGKVFTGLSISLGIIPISNFERPAHEYMKDADGMAECAKKQAGAVRIHYDHRIAQEDRRADKKSHSSVGRRYVNGG